jgi:predicted DNA-binding protein
MQVNVTSFHMKKPSTTKKSSAIRGARMLSVRLEEEVHEALAAAGKAEDRSSAYVARRAILEWLKKKGFLK